VGQVRDDALSLVVTDDGAERDRQLEVLPLGPVHAAALAVRAARGLEVTLELIVDECRGLDIGHEDDRASPASVAAVRTALRHVLLAPERGAAGAAGSRRQMYASLVDEHRNHVISSWSSARSSCYSGYPD
jgi:hypothetical protein